MLLFYKDDYYALMTRYTQASHTDADSFRQHARCIDSV